MELCRILLSDKKYCEFWQMFDDVKIILQTYGRILSELDYFQKHRDSLKGMEALDYMHTYLPNSILWRFYRVCVKNKQDFNLAKWTPCLTTLDELFYQAATADHRRHLFSDLMPDYQQFQKWYKQLVPQLKVKLSKNDSLENQQRDVTLLREAAKKYLSQYGIIPILHSQTYHIDKRHRVQIYLTESIIPYLGVSETNRYQLERIATYAIYYARFFIERITYLAEIYQIPIGQVQTPPSFFQHDVNKFEDIDCTPFTKHGESCIKFITEELSSQKSKRSRMLANIILAMEQNRLIRSSYTFTEIHKFLSQHIPNIPIRQGISKHLSTYKSSPNRSSRSYGGITDTEIDTMAQRIQDFIAKMNS